MRKLWQKARAKNLILQTRIKRGREEPNREIGLSQIVYFCFWENECHFCANIIFHFPIPLHFLERRNGSL